MRELLKPGDWITLLVFGAVGLIMKRAGWPRAPLILGFILGPLIEENMRRALLISKGDPMVFVQRPISGTFLVLTLLLIVLLAAPMIRSKRQEVFQEEQA